MAPRSEDPGNDHWPGAYGDGFDVIELSYDELNQRRLAQEIGRSVGVGLAPKDSYTVMAQGGTKLAYKVPTSGSKFGDVAWGEIGPSVDASALSERGWLGGFEATATPNAGGGKLARSASGSVTLSPLCRAGIARGGPLRARIGPYAFELRIPSGWDSGLPAPVVLASQDGVPVQALTKGMPVHWGSEIPQLGGGGVVTVEELDNDHAKLTYYVAERSVIVLGGGVLHRNGTLLVGTDGAITHIPPGDPYEHRFTELFHEIERLAEIRSREIDHG